MFFRFRILGFLYTRSDSVSKKANTSTRRGFRETLRSDFRDADLRSGLKREFDDVMEFFLTEEEKANMHAMSPLRRVVYVPFRILGAMILRLTPVRRILLLLGILFLIFSGDASDTGFGGGQIVGMLLLLFVLLLELKDKVLARDELEAGRAVQTALMPDERPSFRGWDVFLYTRPANDVGGDLVDFIYVGENRLGLSLGDVAGKGLGAALFMAKLQATLRALAPRRSSICDLGQQLSEIFDRDGLPNRFASLVYLEIAHDDDVVSMLNAGHMPPLIVRETCVEEMPRGGPALGLMLHKEYRELVTRLGNDDVLVAYSDGVTEARNEAGAFFGEERLKKLLHRSRTLPVEQIGRLVLESVDRFAGGAPRHDDVSLLLLRRMQA